MEKMDAIIESCVATVVGIALVTTFVIPTCFGTGGFISSLTGDLAKYNTLLSAVVMMCIVGLIVGVIRYFTKSDR